MLFDYGIYRPFIAQYFVTTIKLAPKVLIMPFEITSPVNRIIVLRWACRQIMVSFDDLEFLTNLVILPMDDFDIILGMYWLFTFRAKIACFAKTVTF